MLWYRRTFLLFCLKLCAKEHIQPQQHVSTCWLSFFWTPAYCTRMPRHSHIYRHMMVMPYTCVYVLLRIFDYMCILYHILSYQKKKKKRVTHEQRPNARATHSKKKTKHQQRSKYTYYVYSDTTTLPLLFFFVFLSSV